MTPVELLLSKLPDAKPSGDGWITSCPAHDDRRPSLRIREGEDGLALVYCHAGCSLNEICRSLGISESQLFVPRKVDATKPAVVARYDYRDESGALLYQVLRYPPKDFRQRRPDGRGGWVWKLAGVKRVIYRLPELLEARGSRPEDWVFVVEGEKDVDRLRAAGLVATCNPGGAGKRQRDYSEVLRGARVCVVADKDEAGRRHAAMVAGSLRGIAADVRVLELPGEDVKDASDWLDAGGCARSLLELTELAGPIDPGEQPQEETSGGGDAAEVVDEPAADEARRSQSRLLLDLAADLELWHDADGNAYATVSVAGHSENHLIKERAFRSWITHQFWLRYKKVPGTQALQDALGVLAGIAAYEGRQHPVAVRVAEMPDAIYIDLASDDWRVVKVTADGWELIHDPPVRFVRKRAMRPLPTPTRGGSVEELRRFVNVREERDFVLLVAWLLAALRGRGPYPVLALYGEQGSCKSTGQRMLRALVDPNRSPLRSAPKDERDLIIAASNSHVLCLDNLSHIRDWLSDALCRLSTGGGFSTRELYTDDKEVIFEATRPAMLNGITDVATRPDLLDRSLIAHLMPLAEADRRPEDELWQEFNEAAPRIFGALLDAMVAGLANFAEVKLDRLPRMADFAKWVVACERGLGWTPGTFMDAYMGSRDAANESAIEGSSIGCPLVSFMEGRQAFSGTATEIMEAIEERLPKDRSGAVKLPAGWPRSPRSFSGELRRVAPNLRAKGIDVRIGGHTNRGTLITLERAGRTLSPPSPPSQALADTDLGGDGPGDCNAGSPARPSPAPSPRNSCSGNFADDGDEGDGESLLHSVGVDAAAHQTLDGLTAEQVARLVPHRTADGREVLVDPRYREELERFGLP